MERLVSALGIVVVLLICVAVSNQRKAIQVRTVLCGVGLQILVACCALLFPLGVDLVTKVGNGVTWFLGFAHVGSQFLFGKLADTTQTEVFGFQFALTLLSILVFLGSVSSILFHYGILQRFVVGMSWVMQRTMKTTGVESLSAAANVFLGQVDAPLLVRHFIPQASSSELFALMVGGFATIAGTMMGVYITMGIPANMLITASLMAAPGALALAKIVYPHDVAVHAVRDTGEIRLNDTSDGDRSNLVDAVAQGAWDGLKIAPSVIVVLMAFKSLVAVTDASLGWTSQYCASIGVSGIPTSLDQILAWLFMPFAWLLGIPSHEVASVASLLGVKISQTEFLAYNNLSQMITAGELSSRTVMMTTVLLCGFANIMSIGIQIGGFGMMAPQRRAEVARLGFKAMCIGALANLMSACIVGLML